MSIGIYHGELPYRESNAERGCDDDESPYRLLSHNNNKPCAGDVCVSAQRLDIDDAGNELGEVKGWKPNAFTVVKRQMELC